MQKTRVQNFWESALPAQEAARARSTPRFDLLFALLTMWFIGGSYLDGWAHIHVPDLETFFTPWHGVLYSGYLVTALALFGILFLNLRKGYSFWKAIPVGYELSLAGAVLFVFGGFGDLLWHTLFGIEANLDALLSPTHLTLAVAAALIVTGPLRATWRRPQQEMQDKGFLAFLPAILSLTVFYSLITFFIEYASPFADTIPAAGHISGAGGSYRLQALGIAGFLLQTAVLMGILLFALRRWHLPLGSMTIILTLNTLAMVLMHNGAYATGTPAMLGVGLLAGAAGDLLVDRLQPSAGRPSAFRLFSFLMPICLFTLYFLALFVFGGGVWWTVHMWVGTIFLSGVVGFLLSYAFLPPPLPEG